jgi:Ca2+-binding RTX toxin-like protein
VLTGGSGADVLIGGAGSDLLAGGAGNDLFVYQATSDSAVAARDLIKDFTQGADKINLSGIDAVASALGDQAFNFIGTAEFSGTGSAGQLRYVYDAATNRTTIYGDVDGGGADFAIDLDGQFVLGGSDFIL